MVQDTLAEMLVEMDRSVITFDVPGAYRSRRDPVGDMDEMIRSADEALDRLGIQGQVDVVGHSMGGFTALAYAVERPQRTKKLVMITSLSGFPAAARWGFPGSAFHFTHADYWRILLWGVRLNAGRGNLAMHKRMQNLMEYASYHKKDYFTHEEITMNDYEQGVPIRTIWSKNMYTRLSYADRLDEVQSSTLILAGRYDPQAPVQCSEELQQGIPHASLVVFEHSGHFPFIEESMLFKKNVHEFLNQEDEDS
jgi:proline iminopeptidase